MPDWGLDFSLKLSRFAFDVTSTFVFFLARLAEIIFGEWIKFILTFCRLTVFIHNFLFLL